ncbi:MAG: helix-hairpin-helix domain-containing protein [Pleurocapsa sp.]
MSNQDQLEKTPNWVWYSFIPTFGGLAITYAGNKTKTSKWVWLGVGFVASSVLLSTELIAVIWLAQIGTAFYLKKNYLIKTSGKQISTNDVYTARVIAKNQEQVDINNCTQNDLVYTLGLPIVYANDIKALVQEGYIFTYLEELSEVAGIPENYLKKIEPLITFSYDINKEADISWRRLNTLSLNDLIACNIEPSAAQKIIEERKNGTYKSLIDVRKRTGIPINIYQHLV